MELTPNKAKSMVETILKSNLVPMLTGSPGVGKSDIIKAVAQKFNLKLIDIRLAQCDPTYLCGFPTHTNGRMDFAPPTFFPLEGDPVPKGYNGWLIFFDEFSSAPLSVQSAAYKVVLDRLIGTIPLHKNVAIVCAGNKETDGAITNRLSTAMQSRLIHLELCSEIKEWLEWAAENGIDHRIMSYLKTRPDQLHAFDPKHNDKTFSCPRTWMFASKILKNCSNVQEALPILMGTISTGVAREFVAYTSVYSNIPTIDECINNPSTVPLPLNQPGSMYALAYMVAAYIDEQSADSLIQLVARMPLEFGVICMRAALKKNRDLITVNSISAWAQTLSQELFDEEDY